jgi:hypothetical protein
MLQIRTTGARAHIRGHCLPARQSRHDFFIKTSELVTQTCRSICRPANRPANRPLFAGGHRPQITMGSPSTGYNYTTITPILYMTIPMYSSIQDLLNSVIAIQIG